MMEDIYRERVIKKSNGLITLGLGYDWSFEKDFYDFTKKRFFVTIIQ